MTRNKWLVLRFSWFVWALHDLHSVIEMRASHGPKHSQNGSEGASAGRFVQDAAIDEYICTMLLTLMPGIDLVGVIIVNADCLAEPAMQAASKLQQFLRRKDVPVALSRARGWNAFP